MLKFRKITAMICALSLMATMLITTVSADTSVSAALSNWDGTVAGGFAGGDGDSAATAYLITNAAELARAVKSGRSSMGKYYKLANDIVINSDLTNNPTNWYGGSVYEDWVFCGTFDGNGHTISGLYYSGSDQYAGLFPIINQNARIKNLGIKNSIINGGECAGVIAGDLYMEESVDWVTNGYSPTYPSLVQCYIAEDVTVSADYAGGFVGRAVGYGDVYISLYNCFIGASINGRTDNGADVGNGWSSWGPFGFHSCPENVITTTPFNTDLLIYIGNNVYTTADDANMPDWFTKLTEAEAKGAAAKENMSGLNFTTIWQTNEGAYPSLRIFNGDTINIWDGTTATVFAGGEGTEASPYQIKTAAQLRKMAAEFGKDSDGNSLYYVLTADIYLNDTSAIGKWETQPPANNWYSDSLNSAWKGQLDGAGHTVYGLYSKTTTNNYWLTASLIQQYAPGASIKNLHIRNSYLSAPETGASAIFGSCEASGDTTAVTLSGCSVDASVIINAKYAGGLFAVARVNLTVDNCWVACTSNTIIGATYGGAMYGDTWDTEPYYTFNVSNSYFDGCVPYYSGRVPHPGTDNGIRVNNSYIINPVDSDATRPGFTTVSSYSEMELNASDWYRIGDNRPLLRNRGVVLCDVDADDKDNLDANDLVALRKFLLGIEGYGNIISDVNKDGSSDVVDFVTIKKIIAGFNRSNPVYKSLRDADVINKIKVMGRYETDNGISLNWTASTLDFNIYGGGTITADIIYNAFRAESGYDKLYFTVYVDGVRQSSRLCLSGSSNGEAQSTVIAEDIQIGYHNIQIVRQTEAYFGTVDVTGLSFDGHFTERTSDSLLVEFVGDSITVGMGNLGKAGDHQQPITQQPDFQDGTQAYAYMTAKNLGVDYRIVSRTGIGAAYGWSDGADSNFLQCYNYQNIFAGNYNDYKPDREADILCINLGTNDKWCGKCPDDATLTRKYIELINLIKKYNPSVKKIVFIVGGINNSYLKAVQDAVASLGGEESNYYLCQTSYGLTAGEQGHPDAAQHKTLSDEVTAFIREKVIAVEN